MEFVWCEGKDKGNKSMHRTHVKFVRSSQIINNIYILTSRHKAVEGKIRTITNNSKKSRNQNRRQELLVILTTRTSLETRSHTPSPKCVSVLCSDVYEIKNTNITSVHLQNEWYTVLTCARNHRYTRRSRSYVTSLARVSRDRVRSDSCNNEHNYTSCTSETRSFINYYLTWTFVR